MRSIWERFKNIFRYVSPEYSKIMKERIREANDSTRRSLVEDFIQKFPAGTTIVEVFDYCDSDTHIIKYRALEHHIPVICASCCYYVDYCNTGRPYKKSICKAFPDGISLDIWMCVNHHTSPYPGDNRIHFTPLRPDLPIVARLKHLEEMNNQKEQ